MKAGKNALPNNSISPTDTQMMYYVYNSKFLDYLEYISSAHVDLKLKKKKSETKASSSYLDLYSYIDNGELTSRIYDERDDFHSPIVNFPFLSSNVPSAPAYGVYVSQLVRYARACSEYQDFIERGWLHHDLANTLNVAVSKTYMPASVAQLDAPSKCRPGGREFNPRRCRQHSFVEIDHEIFSTVILSLQLIQEGQLSVSGERICTILVNRLED